MDHFYCPCFPKRNTGLITRIDVRSDCQHRLLLKGLLLQPAVPLPYSSSVLPGPSFESLGPHRCVCELHVLQWLTLSGRRLQLRNLRRLAKSAHLWRRTAVSEVQVLCIVKRTPKFNHSLSRPQPRAGGLRPSRPEGKLVKELMTEWGGDCRMRWESVAGGVALAPEGLDKTGGVLTDPTG